MISDKKHGAGLFDKIVSGVKKVGRDAKKVAKKVGKDVKKSGQQIFREVERTGQRAVSDLTTFAGQTTADAAKQVTKLDAKQLAKDLIEEQTGVNVNRLSTALGAVNRPDLNKAQEKVVDTLAKADPNKAPPRFGGEARMTLQDLIAMSDMKKKTRKRAAPKKKASRRTSSSDTKKVAKKPAKKTMKLQKVAGGGYAFA